MIEYNLVNGKLQIDPATLTVSAFNAIWNHDKNPKKTNASNMLTYIFTMKDLRQKNPFRDLPFSQKEAACKKNAFGDRNHKFSEQENELIELAFAWMDHLNSNATQRLSIAMDRKIDQMSDFLMDSANDVKNQEQFDAQSEAMQKIHHIIKSKKMTDELVASELAKEKVHGGQVRSPLAAGLFDKKSDGKTDS